MNYKFRMKPYKHQLTALEKSWNKATYAYFMEMGTGKTKVLIDNLAMLYDKGKVNGALIIAPKGVVGTWYNNEFYRSMKIQPAEFINENKLLFAEGNAIKYICRHQSKGKAEDIEKAMHYLEMVKLQH